VSVTEERIRSVGSATVTVSRRTPVPEPYLQPHTPPGSVAQWLRYCASNRKVAGSIPDGVTGIFH